MQSSPDFEYIPTFLDAARRGAEILNRYFGEMLVTTQKTTAADFQTKADLESEAAILAVLEKAYPNFNVLSEERGETKRDSEYTLVIDPLDGTNNFATGIPNFTILIALMKDKRVIASLVYHPVTELAYYAEEGKGAYCNNRRINVNQESSYEKSSLSYIPGYVTARTMCPKMMAGVVSKLKIKRFHHNWSGAADMCLFAAGKLDLIINDRSQIYDFTAAKLIAREAGAKIFDKNGGPSDDDTDSMFLMTNGVVDHGPLLKIWQEVRAEVDKT